jgi:hypothetical protein
VIGLLFGLVAAPAMALPVNVTSDDLSQCDPLAVPPLVDELGNFTPPFPPDELIAAGDQQTSLSACPPFDGPAPNVLVFMTNLTTRAFDEVWYVADPETSLTNLDGLVNNEPAFRIDSLVSDPGGINHPLRFESIAVNDIFEPGETWEFIIDDYFNAAGIAASTFGSGPAVGFLSVGDVVSSGSIIATPEPSTALLLGLGLTAIAWIGRRRTT